MKTDMGIVDLLAWDMRKKLTINEIAKVLGVYYSLVHGSVEKLAKYGVVTKTKAGKAYLCAFNAENEEAIAMLQLAEIEKKKDFYGKNRHMKTVLEDFVDSLDSKPGLLSVVLFGSYAKGDAGSDSDIDILVVINGRMDAGKMSREIYAKYGKEISIVVMSANDFRMQRDSTIIRDILSSHFILQGAENFIGLVFK